MEALCESGSLLPHLWFIKHKKKDYIITSVQPHNLSYHFWLSLTNKLKIISGEFFQVDTKIGRKNSSSSGESFQVGGRLHNRHTHTHTLGIFRSI